MCEAELKFFRVVPENLANNVNSKVDNRGPGVSSTVLGLNPAYQHVWKL